MSGKLSSTTNGERKTCQEGINGQNSGPRPQEMCTYKKKQEKESVGVGDDEISPESLGLQLSVEHSSNTQEALGSMPSTARRKRNSLIPSINKQGRNRKDSNY